jgi:hypothetical protein
MENTVIAPPISNNFENDLTSPELDLSNPAGQVGGQAITDLELKKETYNKAVEAIIVADQIKNNVSDLAKDYAFADQDIDSYWWDVFKIFDRVAPLSAINQKMQITSEYSGSTTKLSLQNIKSDVSNPIVLQMTIDWPNANIQQYHNGNFVLYEVDQTTTVIEQVEAGSFNQNIIFKFKPNIDQIITNLKLSPNLKIEQIETGELIVSDMENNGWIFILPAKLVDRKGNSVIMPMQFDSNTNQITWNFDRGFMEKASYPVVMQF